MRIKDDKLSIALNSFVDEMDEVLGEKEEQGKIGWDDPRCSQYIFYQMVDDARSLCHEELTDDQLKKIYVDIANRCMMLWYQLECSKQPNNN